MVNIVLHEPEIPANTGNIGRTCVATHSVLHLIEPLGFRINDKMLKRAGLDYWDKLDVRVYEDFEDFLKKNPGDRIYMATTKSRQTYADVTYEDGCQMRTLAARSNDALHLLLDLGFNGGGCGFSVD